MLALSWTLLQKSPSGLGETPALADGSMMPLRKTPLLALEVTGIWWRLEPGELSLLKACVMTEKGLGLGTGLGTGLRRQDWLLSF